MAVDPNYNTLNYQKVGGSEWAVGGTLDILAGGALKMGGVPINPGIAQVLTASGAVLPGVECLELNHASVVIAATMVATEHPGFFYVVDSSATGTANHTLTLTGGTFDGTHTIATFNLLADALLVFFDAAGNGRIITNTGSVALS